MDFLKDELRQIFTQKRRQKSIFLANAGVHEVKTEIFGHHFSRSLRNYSKNAKILEDLIKGGTFFPGL